MAPTVLEVAKNPATDPAKLARIVQTARDEEARRAALSNPNLELVEVALPLLSVREGDTYSSKKGIWAAILANPQWEFLLLGEPDILTRVPLWDYWRLWFGAVWKQLIHGGNVSDDASEVIAHAIFDMRHPPEWYRDVLTFHASETKLGDTTGSGQAFYIVDTMIRKTFNALGDEGGRRWILRLYLTLYHRIVTYQGELRYLVADRNYQDHGMESLAALLGLPNPDAEPAAFVRRFHYSANEDQRRATLDAIRQQMKKVRTKEVDRWVQHIFAAHITYYDDVPELFAALYPKRGFSPTYAEQWARVDQLWKERRKDEQARRASILNQGATTTRYEDEEIARLEDLLARFQGYAP